MCQTSAVLKPVLLRLPPLQAAAALVDVGNFLATLGGGDLAQFLLQLWEFGGWFAGRVLLGTRHGRTSFGLWSVAIIYGEEDAGCGGQGVGLSLETGPPA